VVASIKAVQHKKEEQHPLRVLFFFFATVSFVPPRPTEEVVGEQVKTPRCGVFMPRYPTKQGEMKRSCALRTFRLCDWGGQEPQAAKIPSPKSNSHLLSFTHSNNPY
jgi:hypothetical protein